MCVHSTGNMTLHLAPAFAQRESLSMIEGANCEVYIRESLMCLHWIIFYSHLGLGLCDLYGSLRASHCLFLQYCKEVKRLVVEREECLAQNM